MKFGEIVESFSIPPHPKGISIEGRLVDLKPLNSNKYAKELFLSNSLDEKGINWAYLPYGPFDSQVNYVKWIKSFEEGDDPEIGRATCRERV